MQKSILIVGHGYLGGHLSKILQTDTFRIFATTRDRAKLSDLGAKGIKGICFDVLDVDQLPIEEEFFAIVQCVGFDRNQNASRHQVYCDGLRNLLDKIEKPPRKFVYISSTGVYGQSDGQWVTENSETQPTREGGQACLAAENILRTHFEGPFQNTEVAILRLAGIYGPDRIPNRRRLEDGNLSMDANGFLNLIHAQDAAGICKMLIEREPIEPGIRLYNVADGKPPTRQEFYHYLAHLLQVKLPELENPVDRQPGKDGSRREGSKRVDNRKLVAETGYQFQYPTFKEGLDQIVN